jgi:hypothetical protein
MKRHSPVGLVGHSNGGSAQQTAIRSVLEYLSRYTHRVAISNQRLVAFDERGVTFRWKEYRATGRTCYKTMTREAGEFMRRFLLLCCPAASIASVTTVCSPTPCVAPASPRVRELLHVMPEFTIHPEPEIAAAPVFVCRHCGAPMIVIEILQRTAPIPPSPMT